MKKLKFFFLVLIMVSFIFSCSSSDDNNTEPTETNLIVGTWKYKDEIDSCTDKTTWVFKDNGQTFWYYYEEHLGECNYYPESGSWSKISEGKYKLFIEGGNLIMDISFPTNNTMKWSYEDSVTGGIDYQEFIRVE